MMLSLVLLLAVAQIPAPAPTHHWRLTAEHITDQTLKPQAGKLSGSITGPVAFGKDSPKALIIDGNSKKKHGVIITDKIADEAAPFHRLLDADPRFDGNVLRRQIRVKKTMEWGGFVGA